MFIKEIEYKFRNELRKMTASLLVEYVDMNYLNNSKK